MWNSFLTVRGIKPLFYLQLEKNKWIYTYIYNLYLHYVLWHVCKRMCVQQGPCIKSKSQCTTTILYGTINFATWTLPLSLNSYKISALAPCYHTSLRWHKITNVGWKSNLNFDQLMKQLLNNRNTEKFKQIQSIFNNPVLVHCMTFCIDTALNLFEHWIM